MNDDQKRAFLAVVLSGIILFGWQYFFAPKNPAIQPGQYSSGQDAGKMGSQKEISTIAQGTASSPAIAAGLNLQQLEERTLQNNNDTAKITLNNHLVVLNLSNSKEKFSFSSILESKAPLEIQIMEKGEFKSIPFQISQPSAGVIKGNSQEYGLEFNGELLESGKFSYQLISKVPVKLRFIIRTIARDMAHRHSKEFLVHSEGVTRFKVGKQEKGEGLAQWFGVDFNYHLFAISFKEKKSISYNSNEEGVLIVDTNKDETQFEGSIIYSKKNYDDLVSLGENIKLSVDFGVLGLLAVPILRILQYLYHYIPNYGLAIILLTIIMKLLTFPLQHKSYKSMKKMQVIQPELAKLREKFKDDPQRMQKESMDLFKKAGANPLSGCLPLLLQTPIFFAFYKVLDSAVELVGAPFFVWIHDLSIKDPFYVLPVIMTLVMFVQQRMTPNTSTDPAQKKVMMFMPLIFGLIMKDLPSGLTLYILVSTLCGIIQQTFVFKFLS